MAHDLEAHGSYGVYPITQKSGRVRTCYVIAQSTLLEIYKTQKDAKAKKEACHIISFADVFNVCIQREPVRFKADCICIMDPGETFLLLPNNSEYSIGAWHDWILERTRECRSNKLLRPVFREEFFEVSWDVLIVVKPKLRKGYSKPDAPVDDLVRKKPQIEGSGELWMKIEHGMESAKAIHERISEINLREAERRRTQGVKVNLPTVSASVLKSIQHRERSQTQNQRRHKKSIVLSPLKEVDVVDGKVLREPSFRASNNEARQTSEICSSNEKTLSFSLAATCTLGEEDIPTSKSRKTLTRLLASRFGKVSLSAQSSPTCPAKKAIAPQSISSARNSLINNLLGFRQYRNDDSPQEAVASAGASHGTVYMEVVHTEPSTSSSHLNQRRRQGNSPAGQVFQLPKQAIPDCCELNGEDYVAYNPQEQGQGGADSVVAGLSGQSGSVGSHGSTGSSQHALLGHYSGSIGSYGIPTGPMHQFSSVSTAFTALPDSRKSSSSHYELMRNSVAESSSTSKTLDPGRTYSYSQATEFKHRSKFQKQQNHCEIAQTPPGCDYLAMDQGRAYYGSTGISPSEHTAAFPLQEVRSYVSNSSESCCLTPPSLGKTGSVYSNEGDIPRAYSLGSRPLGNQQHFLVPSSDPSKISCTSTKHSPPSMRFLQPCRHTSKAHINHSGTLGGPPSKTSVCTQLKDNQKESTVQHSLGSHINSAVYSLNKSEQIAAESRSETTHSSTQISDQAKSSDRILEMRKRAHSYGSKLMRPSLRRKKLLFQQLTAINPLRDLTQPVNINLQRKRAGSDAGQESGESGSCDSRFFGSPNFNLSFFSRNSQCDSDHVEIDFERDSCPSMDSLTSTSRHSSIGARMSTGIRASLDLALISHKHRKHPHNLLQSMLPTIEKPSDRLIRQRQQLGHKGSPSAIARKRSVPELLQQQSLSKNSLSMIKQIDQRRPSENIVDQIIEEQLSPTEHRKGLKSPLIKESPTASIGTLTEISVSGAKSDAAKGLNNFVKPTPSATKENNTLIKPTISMTATSTECVSDDYVEISPVKLLEPPGLFCKESGEHKVSNTPSLMASKTDASFRNGQQQYTYDSHSPRTSTPVDANYRDDYGIIIPAKKCSTSSFSGALLRSRLNTASASGSESFRRFDRSLSPVSRGRSPTTTGSIGGLFIQGSISPRMATIHWPELANSRCGSFSQSSSPVMSMKRRFCDAVNTPSSAWLLGVRRKISKDVGAKRKHSATSGLAIGSSGVMPEAKAAVSVQLLDKLRERHHQKQLHKQRGDGQKGGCQRGSSAERYLQLESADHYEYDAQQL